MKKFIEQIHQNIDIDLEKLKQIREEIVSAGIPLAKAAGISKDWDAEKDGSISFLDCIFLNLLVRKYKPQTILEIGTWFGTSAAILCESLDFNSRIYTCDKNKVYTNLDKYKNNIVSCPVHSSILIDFLNQKKIKIDYVFVDGGVTPDEAKILVEMMGDDLFFSTHDYKLPKDKGVSNMRIMETAAKEANLKTISFCPDKEIPGKGYNIGKKYNINSSVGVVMSEKVYKSS